MSGIDERIIGCSEFEDLLTDYLDGSLDKPTHKAAAAHALCCPLCHALLNEVKNALQACREITAPKRSMTHLEARILSMTMPQTAMSCEQFEEHLTDYLDGFLPATLFHRWERHAVLCEKCTDLPGTVVRSIAACYAYKMEELSVPTGLHDRILQATIGTTEATQIKAAWSAQFLEWTRGLSFPIPVPQLASISMMLILAALIFSQTITADDYQKGFELAEYTYKQGADIVFGSEPKEIPSTHQKPIEGTEVSNQE